MMRKKGRQTLTTEVATQIHAVLAGRAGCAGRASQARLRPQAAAAQTGGAGTAGLTARGGRQCWRTSLPVVGDPHQLPADIMQRRMPAAQQGDSSRQPTRVRSTPLQSLQPYSLQEHSMTPELWAELAELERFCTTRFFGQMAEPLQPVTYRTVTKHYVRLLLGYAHNVRGTPLDQLSLATLVPSPGREGVSLLMDYQHWRQQQRALLAAQPLWRSRQWCMWLAFCTTTWQR
ncbi:hypothetical protein COO60DRAFT_994730 [Scenedesmus sp. NREL 46B-D3]|nr:hypothetical protein COO60DRAFT_994730 [Scenedesmus sp. NREL 46B-D3]